MAVPLWRVEVTVKIRNENWRLARAGEVEVQLWDLAWARQIGGSPKKTDANGRDVLDGGIWGGTNLSPAYYNLKSIHLTTKSEEWKRLGLGSTYWCESYTATCFPDKEGLGTAKLEMSVEGTGVVRQVGLEIWNKTKGTSIVVDAVGTPAADKEISAAVGDDVLIKQPHDTALTPGDEVAIYYGEYGQPAQGFLDTRVANADGYWQWEGFTAEAGGVPASEAGTSKRYFVFVNSQIYSDGIRLKVSGVGAKGQITDITYPTTEQPTGAAVEIRGSTKNIGDATGNFYMRLWDRDTGAKVMEPPRADNIPPGGSFTWSFKPIMPSKPWNLRVTVER